jgi:hypothetical protein
MSKLNINRLTNENEDGAPKITGITSFSSSAFLETPKGTTAQRPENVSPGMIRFNTDSGHLEYYNGVEWTEVLVANNTLDGGARGVFGSGENPQHTLDYITISTLGNSQTFGDYSTTRYAAGSCSDSTRGLWAGGQIPSPFTFYNLIDYITFASTGNTTDFGGDLVNTTYDVTGTSNSTRGLFAYGTQGPGFTFVAKIDYVTIQSTGTNAQSFGNLSTTRNQTTSFSSSVRGVFAGGMDPGIVNTIDYVTISTLGNAQYFGDLPTTRRNPSSCSNSTRGVIAGGFNPTYRNEIEFITIATTGNAQDFGDLTIDRGFAGGVSSSTRGVFGGGSDSGSPGNYDTIDYITFSSTGNAIDFGNLVRGESRVYGACSNGHGGL